MKKLLLTVLIAAMMALPLGTVAFADDEMPVPPSTANEEYVPGEVPAAASVDFMAPALHAVLLAMETQELASFTADDEALSWEMLYNLLSMYGQMDDRAVYDGELMILPAETVMDYSASLFSAPPSAEALPESLSDRMSYKADTDEYLLYCGNDDLSEVVITNIHDLGNSVAVSGKLMFLAEEIELASFTATLTMADNLFGYTLTGLDLI